MSQDYECNPQNVRLKTFVTRKRWFDFDVQKDATNALTKCFECFDQFEAFVRSRLDSRLGSSSESTSASSTLGGFVSSHDRSGRGQRWQAATHIWSGGL